MPLPEETTVSNEQDLLKFVFNNSSLGTDPEQLASRYIIYPTNAEVDRRNGVIMRFFPVGEKYTKVGVLSKRMSTSFPLSLSIQCTSPVCLLTNSS